MAEQDELPLYDESEFVVGLVCAAGVNYRRCTHVLEAEFKRMGYDTRTVRLSTLMDNLAMNYDLTTVRESLPEGARIRARMSLGNQLRARASNCSIMALAAIQEINQHRISLDGTGTEPALRTVHIVATLKRPEEVEALRQVYGAGFFLLGVHDTEEGRTKYLTEQMGVAEDEAKLLMRDDLYDQQDAGQLTRDTYYLSDVFVSLVAGRYKEQIVRFVELLFPPVSHSDTRRTRNGDGVLCVASIRTNGEASRSRGFGANGRSCLSWLQ